MCVHTRSSPVRAYRIEPRPLVRLPSLLPEILKPVLAAATVAGLARDFSLVRTRLRAPRRAGAFIGMSATNKGAFIASKQMISGRRDRIVPFGESATTIRGRLDRNYFGPCLAPVTTIRPPKIEFR